MVKKIFLTVAVVICCGAVLVAGAWCSAQVDSSPCTEVHVVVKDSLERQFVTAEEMEGYLKRHHVYPQGKSMQQIDCHAIEQCLQKHDMVREVSCYKSPFGGVYIELTQRVPVLSVVSNDGCYYVDSDRRIMPVHKQISVDIPVFRGTVSQRAATEEYFDFVMWINNDKYWSLRIKYIYVANPKSLILTQEGERAKIMLGSLDGYVEKLDKLQTLYTKGLNQIEHPDYREYDLRYNGQVVGRK